MRSICGRAVRGTSSGAGPTAPNGDARSYKEVAPPERLVSTESWGGNWPETVNTLILTEEGGKTTITHRMLYPSKEARDTAMKTGMKDGVIQSFDRLAEYVRTMR